MGPGGREGRALRWMGKREEGEVSRRVHGGLVCAMGLDWATSFLHWGWNLVQIFL